MRIYKMEKRMKRTTLRRVTVLTASLPSLLIAAGAGAQEEAPPVVKVLGHYDNSVGTSDAASQGTVTAGLIANRPALRPGELLEFVPGVIVTQHSGDGKANQYFLRGFNLDHGTDFATYVDGMPVNMRSNAHGQGYSDLNFLIPELVQRIDYKKGPYFADEGDFASAGAARWPTRSRRWTAHCCTALSWAATTGRGTCRSRCENIAARCATAMATRTTATASPRWLTRTPGTRPTRSRCARCNRA